MDIILKLIFCTFFTTFLKLSHFSGNLTMKVNAQWIPCVHNSSYSFISILLNFSDILTIPCRCVCGLDKILRLILTLNSQFELSHFFLIGQRVPCVQNSSYSYIPILLKLYRCLDHVFEMFMWYGYNPQINFGTYLAI